MIEIIHPNFFVDLMIQRPHQLLKQFAKQGYRAVLHNINNKRRDIIQRGENYFIYNGVFPSLSRNNKRVLWISYPPLYTQIGSYKEDLVVFDCIDFPGEQFAHWIKGYEILRQKADVIFVTSDTLYSFNKNYQNKTFLCKNGADFEYFAAPNKHRMRIPKDMVNIKKPIVGYIGAVAEWIDWELIRYLATSDKVSLVFVGPLFGLKQIPIDSKNVYFLGRKDYSFLANYIANFDVCMVPFRKSKLTAACNPVKMYEYLSMGKPVVATDLEECRINVVKASKSYEEFYRNILLSLGQQSKKEIEMRVNFAKENSWEKRVNYIRTIIEPLLDD